MEISFIILLVYIVIVLLLIYQIIVDYNNSSPVKAISWIMAVIFFPVLGMLAYYIVGRNTRKKRSKFQKWRNEFNQQCKREFKFDKNDPIYKNSFTELKTMVYKLERSPVFSGNKIDVYPGGKIKFEHLLKDIENAENHIHIFYYAIGDDKIGRELKNKIIEKVKQGIKVRLIYDGLGCNKTNRNYFRQMTDAGVEVRTFLPLSFPKILRSINYRNHKKIVIIDGKIAYTGGINVKDEYVDGLKWGRWNDCHFKIEGAGAQGLQSVFLADWYYVSNEYLESPQYFPEVGSPGNSPVQIVNAEPLGLNANIRDAIFTAITHAKKYVYIETPYFIPTPCLIRAIETASLSGIDVRLIIPKRSDNGSVQHASNSYIEQMLRNHVKVYQYMDGFTHSKLIVIDDELVIAGSTNIDIRSLELHFETNILIYDKNIANTVKDIYHTDIKNSEQINLDEWIKRSKLVKFKEDCFRLLSPLF